jgi:argininosuccinate synthase
MLTANPMEAPDEPEDVLIGFEQGRPVSVNGVKMPGHELVARLNFIAGPHGVGRVDLVENRCVGMKSRGLYETPGGTVIVEALRGLEEMTLDRETLHFRQELALRFARLVYDGRWFTAQRDAIAVCCGRIAERTTGDVVVRLYKGSATTIKRRSPLSLYSEDFATFGADEVYNQKHAEGFIRLLTLPERIAALKGMELMSGKSKVTADDPGVAPFIGPRTGPVVEPEPAEGVFMKEGNPV